MLKFNIAPIVLESFEYYFSLSDDLKELLIDLLANSSLGESSSSLTATVSREMKLESKKASELISAFANLAVAKESYNANLKDLIDDLSGRISLKGISPDVVSKFILLFFKKCDSFISTIKASNLSFNRDKILLSSKIISDVRPIFSANEEINISGAIIIQSLKIEFREGDETKEYYFALDNEDLNELKLQIQRAERKEQLLNEQLVKSNVPLIKIR